MRIEFSCIGFSSCSAFVVKNGCQHHVGYVNNRFNETYTFTPFGIYERHLAPEEIPTPDQIIEEYKNQLADKHNKPSINNDILYAG